MSKNPLPQLFIGKVDPECQHFDAWENETLLHSMETGSINWPSSCRNGTCRTCIGHLDRGSIRYEIEWPGLSAEEKAEGYVLPCVAFPCSEIILKRGY